jgi:hypothetical protein
VTHSNFVRAWRSSSARLRQDMIAAFRFFPDASEAEKIACAVERIDPAGANRLRKIHIHRCPLSLEEKRFHRDLALWLMEQRRHPDYRNKRILQTRWFDAFLDEGGLYFEPRISIADDEIPESTYWAAHRRATREIERTCYELFWGFAQAARKEARGS